MKLQITFSVCIQFKICFRQDKATKFRYATDIINFLQGIEREGFVWYT